MEPVDTVRLGLHDYFDVSFFSTLRAFSIFTFGRHFMIRHSFNKSLHKMLEYHNMQVIKHPMDLGTIKKRIDEGFYCNVKEMCKDMRLVFANAIKYNAADTDIYFMAIKLSSKFEDWWFPLASKVQEPEQVCYA